MDRSYISLECHSRPLELSLLVTIQSIYRFKVRNISNSAIDSFYILGFNMDNQQPPWKPTFCNCRFMLK